MLDTCTAKELVDFMKELKTHIQSWLKHGKYELFYRIFDFIFTILP